MERGNLTATIPTEIGRLQDLVFLDLDYNALTGTLTKELFSLHKLTQLDLNNNLLSGHIDGMSGDTFPNLQFLQLHHNRFTGTIPPSLGEYAALTVLTVHESHLSGTMPAPVCDLLLDADRGGVLTTLSADCDDSDHDDSDMAPTGAEDVDYHHHHEQQPHGISCYCCTDCRQRASAP
jgi:hypothetical protein